jgi:conjugal transfer/entry exclusion protein
LRLRTNCFAGLRLAAQLRGLLAKTSAQASESQARRFTTDSFAQAKRRRFVKSWVAFSRARVEEGLLQRL